MLARSMPTDPASVAAAQAAFRQSTIEIWTLFAIGFMATVIRTYARVKAVGFRHLKPDDYLVWLGIVRFPFDLQLQYLVASSLTQHNRA